MVLLQVALHHLRQLQIPNTVVRRLTDDRRPAQLLQRKHKVPVQRLRQHRLKEHDARRILVVLQQSGHCVGRVHAWVVTVEAAIENKPPISRCPTYTVRLIKHLPKLVIELLDSGM